MSKEYDDKGRLIYFEDQWGDSHWMEYNNDGEYIYLASTWKDNEKYKGSKIIYVDNKEVG